MYKSFLPRSPASSSDPAPDWNNVAADYNSTHIFRFSHGLTGTDPRADWFYPTAIGYIFAFLLITIFLRRISLLLFTTLRHISTAGHTHHDQQIWSKNMFPFYSTLKRRLLDAPLFKHRHNGEFHLTKRISLGTLPTRNHTLILTIYMLWNLAFCLALPWNREKGHAIIAALRGRSGVLATFNLIPSILFATRNNPLIWILNVNYDTFMLFHRWIARLAAVEAIIHTLCWLVNTYIAGDWAGVRGSLDDALSYRVAAVATGLLIFILVQAWSPVRRAFYDTFVTFHRIAVYGALVCIYLHLYYHGLGQIPFMYAIFGILGFEYLARVWGVLTYNVSIRGRRFTKISVEALPGNISRVTISLAKPWRPRPGAIVHVYIPSLALWTSHPFSISWYSESSSILRSGSELFPSQSKFSEASTICTSSSSVYSVNTLGERQSVVELRRDTRDDQPSSVSTITLLVHARQGMTRKLYNRAKWHNAVPTSPFYTTFGVIESPYSWSSRETRNAFNSYGTVLLFAGGIGITGVLHQILEIASRARRGENSVRKVVLTWAVASYDALSWVDDWVEEILYTAREVAGLDLEIKVFVSEKRVRTEKDVEKGKEEVSLPAWVHDARVKVEYKKCEIEGIVGEVFEKRVGAMVVGVCGPGRLADGVRKAVRGRMGEGSVDFVEEGFSY
ncbi:hypothetical protein ONS96_003886 [Cadophora gregata f. sp. sojae]|nr:hypothetical protein ONS96_003886 [Cadophora gregata f. sp. sojae]